MRTPKEKVVVAMSGGVDSSVAAALLVEQGYDVMGLFMRVGTPEPEPSRSSSSRAAGFSPRGASAVENLSTTDESPPADTPTERPHRGCCSASDAADARFVAGMLDIPFYALNFERDFDRIIDYFADEYARGRTPNPCVVCNDRLKFGKIVDYADAVGAKFIATGHYARVQPRDGHNALLRARDAEKDQSYVLFGIDRTILDRVLFPIGDLRKSEVREIASRFDLPNQDKPDSVDICFVPDRDYARVVQQRRPDAFVKGDVLDASGDVIGQHKGIGHYTIGQRRGLGIAAGKPVYVTQLNVADNTVTLGDADALAGSALAAERCRFLIDHDGSPFRADVKIRYLHRATPATVFPLPDDRVRIVFDNPQRAITPGQAVVFYEGDLVIGGGWIESAEAVALAQ